MVTQPDKPKGRGNTMQFPPVKECAVSHGLEVFQPVKIREDASVEYLKKFAPDIIIVAAFGQILPKSILDLPKYGCINVHASLLPWMSDWIPEISLPKNRCALQKMRQVEVCLTSWRQSAPSCVWKPCRCWKTKRRPLHRRTMRRVPTQR